MLAKVSYRRTVHEYLLLSCSQHEQTVYKTSGVVTAPGPGPALGREVNGQLASERFPVPSVSFSISKELSSPTMNALANGPSPSLSESFACSAKKANCSIQSMKDTHTLLSDKKWRPRRHTQLFTNFFPAAPVWAIADPIFGSEG